MAHLTNSAARFSRLGCADDAIANFPPTLDAGPRRTTGAGVPAPGPMTLRDFVLGISTVLLAALAAAQPDFLPTPTDLRCEYQLAPALAATATPRLSFVVWPNASDKGVAMAVYRLLIVSADQLDPTGPNATVAWDSGVVQSADPTNIAVGAALSAGRSYLWYVQWGSADRRMSRLSAAGRFDVGLLAEADWQQAQWLGAGHGEFKATIRIPPAALDAADVGSARVWISSPGGSVVKVNGVLAGADAVGMSGWYDWTKQMHHTALDIGPLLSASPSQHANEISVSIGCGSWCGAAANGVPTYTHSGRHIATADGARPLFRALLTVYSKKSGKLAAALTTNAAQWSSRVGQVLNSSSWLGSTTDWTVPPSTGWSSPARRVSAEAVAKDVGPITVPLAQVHKDPSRCVCIRK